jgi:8-oxo-dGTP pyrophosphatase MutT (NUDIX family)
MSSPGRYVLGFMFNLAGDCVVLMEKKRPAFQIGMRNGVGGKVNEGETPEVAMARECLEEIGVSTSWDDWRHVATLASAGHYEVEVFACRTEAWKTARQMTDEGVCLVPAERPGKVVSDCRWLIPLCLAALSGDERHVRIERGG